MTVTVQQCVILAGGLGTRLGPLAAKTPKPILPCGDRPFLAWLMREMVRFGVIDFVLLTGHLSEAIEAFAATIRQTLPGVRISLSRDPMQAGTGGALYHARDRLSEKFLLCNGDTLFDCNIADLLAGALNDDAMPPSGRTVVGRLALRQIPDASRYGVVAFDPPYIAAFKPRPEPGSAGLINAGLYVFRRDVIDYLSSVCSLESEALPIMAQDRALTGSVVTGYFRDIGIPGDYLSASSELPSLLRRSSLFLIAPAVDDLATIARASRAGWHVFGLHDRGSSLAERARAAGGTLDAERHGRVGAPMLDEIVSSWEVDPGRAVMFGDGATELGFATASGIRIYPDRQPTYPFETASQ
ncbi:sugar phosphate nucleotidyltransferase [Rhodopila sp.]|uniref:sugar phosphate nucleotidyltransferase n=1 Tax=Rhodopila sp. TaxID=2480087 RepID=UPI003D0A8E80